MQRHSETVEHISGRELYARLRRGEEVVIVDARGQHGYEACTFRPKGSIRIAPGSTDSNIDRLPKDRLIVTV